MARRPSGSGEGYQALRMDGKPLVESEEDEEGEEGVRAGPLSREARGSFGTDKSPSGVNMVEAAQAVWNKRTRWYLFGG